MADRLDVPCQPAAARVCTYWAHVVQADRISSGCLRLGIYFPARNLSVRPASPSRVHTINGKAVAPAGVSPRAD
jgi:hypothetical protein